MAYDQQLAAHVRALLTGERQVGREGDVGRDCDVSKRPMYDWVLVGAEELATEPALDGWDRRGVVFARGLVKA